MDLSTGSSEQQTTAPTSNIQPTGKTATDAAPISRVQPGQVTGLQSSSQLTDSQLATAEITLAPTIPAPAPPSAPKPHTNYALFGFSALLLVVAVVLFWYTGRSAKTTTKR